jgi:hypothetical protein
VEIKEVLATYREVSHILNHILNPLFGLIFYLLQSVSFIASQSRLGSIRELSERAYRAI